MEEETRKESVESETLQDVVEVDESPQAEKEIILGYREFTIQELDDICIRIYRPTVRIDTESDSAYSKEFNRLLRSEDPPLTKAQMEKILHEQGIWTEEDERKLTDTQNQMSALRLKLEGEKEKKKSSAKTIEKLGEQYLIQRNKYMELSSLKQSYFSTTLESQAEDKRWMVRLIGCAKVVDEEGNETPIWTSVDDLLDEVEPILVRRVFFESSLFWHGIDPSIFELLPELET